MALGDILGLSTSSYDASAARARQAAVSAAKKGAKKQAGTLTKYEQQATQQLAPALTNIGDIYAGEKAGYDIRGGALGIPGFDQGAARTAYENFLQPVNEFGIEDLFRRAGQTGTTASGATQRDLYDYGYQTRFQPWLQALNQYDPLAANSQQAQIGQYLAGQKSNLGSNLATVYGNKFNQLGQANVGYQNQLAQNRATVAGNWGNLIGAGAQLAGQAAGAFASGGLSGGSGLGSRLTSLFGSSNNQGPMVQPGYPQLGGDDPYYYADL